MTSKRRLSSVIQKETLNTDNPRKGGYFISFEGVDGCGKSTQIGRLAKHLEALQQPFLLTREPGGTSLGEALRPILKNPHYPIGNEAELLLFAASRAQLVDEAIRPALKADKIVLSDRFTDSTLTYQGFARRGNLNFIHSLNAFASRGLVPHATILLDMPPEMGLKRARARTNLASLGLDRLEQEDLSFYEAVRQAYLELAKQERERFIIIQADQDPNQIEEDIWHALAPRLR